MVNNSSKFDLSTITVKCKINNEDITILVDNLDCYVPLYKFDDDDEAWIYYRYCNSKKIRGYIFQRATLSDIILHSSTIIIDLMITFLSNYKSMSAKHKMHQPRSILESKLIKHIKNASDDDKESEYKFLSRNYNLI